MSPEQARGKPVDKRTRHLGIRLCALRDAHRPAAVRRPRTSPRSSRGSSSTSRTSMRCLASTPAPVRRLLRRCLEKDRRKRLPDIGVARIEIRRCLTSQSTRCHRRCRARAALAWIVAAALIVASIVGALVYSRWPTTESRLLVRASIPLAEPSRVRILGQQPAFAISPDGTRARVPNRRRGAALQPSVERGGEFRDRRNRRCFESLSSLPTADGSRSSSGPR